MARKPKTDAAKPVATASAQRVPDFSGLLEDPQTELVNMDVQLDKDDIILVGISRAEEILNDNIADERAKSAAAEAEYNAIGKQIQQELTDYSNTLLASTLEAATKMVTTIGLPKPESTFTASLYQRQNMPDQIRCSLTVKSAREKKGNRDVGEPELTFHVTETRYTKVTPTLVHLYQQQKMAMEEKSRADEAAMNWKRKLTQMPQLERKLKARVAAERLKTTGKGSALLETLLGSIEKDVLLLPGS